MIEITKKEIRLWLWSVLGLTLIMVGGCMIR